MVAKKLLLSRIFYLTLIVAGSIYYYYAYHVIVDLPRLFVNTTILSSFSFNGFNKFFLQTNIEINSNTSNNVVDPKDDNNTFDSLKDENVIDLIATKDKNVTDLNVQEDKKVNDLIARQDQNVTDFNAKENKNTSDLNTQDDKNVIDLNTQDDKNVTDLNTQKDKNVTDLIENNNLTNKSLPVIVRPIGGLGNQLFQYSTAYAVAKRRNSDLYICTDEVKVRVPHAKENRTFEAFNSGDRSYTLDIFNVPRDNLLFVPPGETECNLIDLPPGNFTKMDIAYFSEVDILNNRIPKDRVVHLSGYTESEIFFEDYKDELKKLLHLEIDPIPVELKSILDDMSQSESVSVHARRGDFISNTADNRSMPLSYYARAIELLCETLITNNITTRIENVKFFIFSDDIENVQRDFHELFKSANYSMAFISNRNFSRIVDFYLMSHCKHNINANSTFSWWAAYLNHYKQRLVIAPLPKFDREWLFSLYPDPEARKIANKIYRGEWCYPKDWITINPFEPE